MTIEEVKSHVTEHDLKTRTIHVLVKFSCKRVRLIAVGRKYLTVLHNGDVVKLHPRDAGCLVGL
jgi:hypothetical protein